MTERPILFNGAMVRAILDGSKTQTRRPVKVQPPMHVARLRPYFGSGDRWIDADGTDYEARCPFGVVGDRLWVRETWAPYHGVDEPVADVEDANAVRFMADDGIYLAEGAPTHPPVKLNSYAVAPHLEMPGGPHRWRPSIHMPRWASRITLEVTDVRVERLQDITEEDAQAEGTRIIKRSWAEGFGVTWCEVYGVDNWHANPWVWAISFKRVTP